MNKILIFLFLSLVVLSSCSLLDNTLSGKGKPTIKDGYIDVTQEQIDAYTQKLEWKGVNLSTLPIEYYYNGSRLWFNWTDNRSVKGYEVELKNTKNFKVHKNKKEIFDISSTTDIHQVDTFEKTGEFAIYSDGWENITYTSDRPLIVKGRYVCYEDTRMISGSGLSKNIQYKDCWYNPDKLDEENKSISFITEINKNKIIISTFGNYDPLTSDYTEGIVSCWGFENNANDYLGINDGSAQGSPSFNSSCIVDGCYNFDGSNDYIDITEDSSFQITNNLSISLWFTTQETSGEHSIIDSRRGFASDGYQIRTNNQNLEFIYQTSSSEEKTIYSASLSANTWYHVGFTVTPPAVKIYLNGVNVANDTGSGTAIGTDVNANLRIGDTGEIVSVPSSFNLFGSIDEVMMWNRLITSDEMSEIYNSGSGVSCQDIYPLNTSLQACWPLEGTGTESTGVYTLDEQGTINSATGKVGLASNFTATSGQYFNNTAIGEAMSGLQAFTWCNWIKSDVTNSDKGWVDDGTPDGSDVGFTWRYDADSGGTIRHAFDVDPGGRYDTETSSGTQTTDWQFLCAAWDCNDAGNNYKVYINGEVNASASISCTYSTTTISELNIGRGPKDASSSWDGLVDEAMFWTRRLSATEISSIYNGSSGVSCNYLLPVGGGGGDTCTYSSGNWNVLCSDNCVISSPVDLNNNNLIISGSGTFTANSAISNVSSTSVECLAAFTNLG